MCGKTNNRLYKMKSFLSKYSQLFERSILKIIGEYSGSCLVNTDYNLLISRLEFSVTKKNQLGKIFMVTENLSKLLDKVTVKRRLLKSRFWVVEKDAYLYFHVVHRLKKLIRILDSLEIENEYLKLLVIHFEQLLVENYILCSDKLRPFRRRAFLL